MEQEAKQQGVATEQSGGGTFVGRERELAQLRTALDEAERGRGSLLLGARA